jgi:xylulose-5-phosphate/fructose-6-phosphate phosphoketolase
VVDGVKIAGTFRAHHLPLREVKTNEKHLRSLEDCMRSYHPEQLFDASRQFNAKLAALAPIGTARMSANPHTNGGLISKPQVMPGTAQYAYKQSGAGTDPKPSATQLGLLLRDLDVANPPDISSILP